MKTKRYKPYAYWLHNIPGIGDKTIYRLLQAFKDPLEIYQAGEGRLKELLLPAQFLSFVRTREKEDPHRAYARMQERGIRFVSILDQEYPERLRFLIPPPFGLYYRGSLPEPGVLAAALIGARECSEYGYSMAEAFGRRLGEAGICIISGMARGIDGIGQQAALAGGGRTYAVLGCGVDICYPASHRKLYDDILNCNGGILSVFPPGTEPKKGLFPERNRIVAGLCDVVLVVEARQKSGTWITVDMALEQGKEVYAVPGRLTDRLSDGCNLLLRQGAGIALSPADLLGELALLKNRKENLRGTDRKSPDRKGLPETVPDLWTFPEKKRAESSDGKDLEKLLDSTPSSTDEILVKLRQKGIFMEPQELLPALVKLCLEGKAIQKQGNLFCRKISSGFLSGRN